MSTPQSLLFLELIRVDFIYIINRWQECTHLSYGALVLVLASVSILVEALDESNWAPTISLKNIHMADNGSVIPASAINSTTKDTLKLCSYPCLNWCTRCPGNERWALRMRIRKASSLMCLAVCLLSRIHAVSDVEWDLGAECRADETRR